MGQAAKEAGEGRVRWSMTPSERIQAMYGSMEAFAAKLLPHLQLGVVHSSPTCFVMARSVRSTWHEEQLLDPFLVEPDGDTWFLYALAGSMTEAIRIQPARKKYIAYERRGVLKLQKFSQIARHVQA